jgi:hypothetical protein
LPKQRTSALTPCNWGPFQPSIGLQVSERRLDVCTIIKRFCLHQFTLSECVDEGACRIIRSAFLFLFLFLNSSDYDEEELAKQEPGTVYPTRLNFRNITMTKWSDSILCTCLYCTCFLPPRAVSSNQLVIVHINLIVLIRSGILVIVIFFDHMDILTICLISEYRYRLRRRSPLEMSKWENNSGQSYIHETRRKNHLFRKREKRWHPCTRAFNPGWHGEGHNREMLRSFEYMTCPTRAWVRRHVDDDKRIGGRMKCHPEFALRGPKSTVLSVLTCRVMIRVIVLWISPKSFCTGMLKNVSGSNKIWTSSNFLVFF